MNLLVPVCYLSFPCSLSSTNVAHSAGDRPRSTSSSWADSSPSISKLMASLRNVGMWCSSPNRCSTNSTVPAAAWPVDSASDAVSHHCTGGSAYSSRGLTISARWHKTSLIHACGDGCCRDNNSADAATHGCCRPRKAGLFGRTLRGCSCPRGFASRQR